MKLLSLVPDLVNLHQQNDTKMAMFSKNLTSVPAANKKKNETRGKVFSSIRKKLFGDLRINKLQKGQVTEDKPISLVSLSFSLHPL